MAGVAPPNPHSARLKDFSSFALASGMGVKFPEGMALSLPVDRGFTCRKESFSIDYTKISQGKSSPLTRNAVQKPYLKGLWRFAMLLRVWSSKLGLKQHSQSHSPHAKKKQDNRGNYQSYKLCSTTDDATACK